MSNNNTTDSAVKLYSPDQLIKLLKYAPYRDLIRCITDKNSVYSEEELDESLKQALGRKDV